MIFCYKQNESGQTNDKALWRIINEKKCKQIPSHGEHKTCETIKQCSL